MITLTEIFLLFIFPFGLCVGSLLNAVIYRLPRNESIVFPRSHCPECKALIRWHQNIPLLSFLMLKGKCASCGCSISFRYPVVELLTAVLFTAAALYQPDWRAWPFAFYFMSAIVACTFIDLKHWILPDKITLPGIVIGLASAFFVPDHSLVQAALGLLVGGGVLYAIAWAYLAATGKDGLGGGDIKFLAMVGAFLGVKGVLVTLVGSSVVGSLFGIFLILLKGRKGNTAIPFGPFLSGGALVAFFFGEKIWQWYFN